MAFCLTKFAVSGLYNKFYFMVPSIYYSFLTMAKTEPSPPNACLPCSCNVAAAACLPSWPPVYAGKVVADRQGKTEGKLPAEEV
jgi:hypothetical protein